MAAGFTLGAVLSTRHAHLLRDMLAAFALRAQLASVSSSARMPAMRILVFTMTELQDATTGVNRVLALS